MPNWVTNNITITCDNDEILNAYFNIIGHQGESFDFDKIIPMPKELEIPSGSDTERGITCVKWFAHPDCPETSDIVPKMTPEQYAFLLKQLGGNQEVDLNALALEMYKVRKMNKGFHPNDPDLEQQDWENILQLGKQACSNAMVYGAKDWYDWCRSNWGTKWNVNQPGDSIIEADGGVWFETAWSAPMPILHRIVEQLASTQGLHGTATIEHRWADEDLGSNCGEQTFTIDFDDTDQNQMGSISWDIRTDNDMGYDTAHDFAMNLWGWEDES